MLIHYVNVCTVLKGLKTANEIFMFSLVILIFNHLSVPLSRLFSSQTGKAPLNLKAEIERVASLVEVLADPLLSQRSQHQLLSQPPQPQQRSKPHPASVTPPMIPNGSAKKEDIHRSFSWTAEPPIGAPLRPRHYVCRERLSSLAATALLRGSGTIEGSGTTLVFAGNSGAGKACLAAEVVTRRDVRAKFGDAVVWLQVRSWLFFRRGGGLLFWILNKFLYTNFSIKIEILLIFVI